jgi:murein DD-endopeptidase MepM/ murein hydrolase activator NlpD
MKNVAGAFLILVVLFTAAWLVAPASHTGSSSTGGLQTTPTPAVPPFRLPFTAPPGPDTWLVGQVYGNTRTAYLRRDEIYRNGQGLHFGVDFIAPCGTPVVAIGDGVVVQVDRPYSSPPHNIMILHDNGFASFYGHLLERPSLTVGQAVQAGEVIALSGDFYETCHSAPHLHLEIRSQDFLMAYNPIDFMAADWDSLLLYGAGGPTFERDLADPRQWQAIDGQPAVHFNGSLLNEYSQPWPPDIRPTATPTATPAP